MHRLTLIITLILALALCNTAKSYSADAQSLQETMPDEKTKRYDLEFEPDAYYTNLGLYLPITSTPIPYVGEKTEAEIYGTLISKALQPRFLAFEVSVNPMPCLGAYIKDHNREFYNSAQVSESFNWVKALTAGFEEPYAFSAFIGNVVDFDAPDRKEMKGKGHLGLLFSAGDYHIKDNELIYDNWREFELKLKGDRKSSVKKLNWSFRVGTKFHDNSAITDIVYISLRRSRVDYKPSHKSILNNSGFEYTFDMDARSLDPIRNYFFVDKKWPSEKRRIAFAIAGGFVWESARKYSGALAAGRERDNLQFIIRPNIEF